MRKNHIISISYLNKDNTRKTLRVRPDGNVRLPVKSYLNGRVKTKYESLSISQAISHDLLKDADPVFTLATGEKVRVYNGGDSSYLPPTSEGIILKHEKENKTEKLRSKMKKKIIIPPKDDYDDLFGFPDISGWDYEDS